MAPLLGPFDPFSTATVLLRLLLAFLLLLLLVSLGDADPACLGALGGCETDLLNCGACNQQPQAAVYAWLTRCQPPTMLYRSVGFYLKHCVRESPSKHGLRIHWQQLSRPHMQQRHLLVMGHG